MSIWYRLDKWKFKYCEIVEVEVVKETAVNVWIIGGGLIQEPKRHKITSNDNLYFRTRELAENEARAILKNRISGHEHELSRLQSALESI